MQLIIQTIFYLFILAFLTISNNCLANSLPSCESQLNKTLCAKIGQMLIIGFGGLKEENGKILWQDPNGTTFKKHSLIARDIAASHIGGIILFEKPFFNSVTGKLIKDRNIQGVAQLGKLVDQLQEYNALINKKEHLPHLPLLISIDEEGGIVDRLPTYRGFQQKLTLPQALGYRQEQLSKDANARHTALEHTRQVADTIAQELADLHINVDFAPSVDVNINPLNPIIGSLGRSFSANPNVVIDQAKQFISGLHDYGIIAAIKHFPGHGSSQKDSHLALVDVTNSYQKNKELLPFKVLIKEGYNDLVMTTHVINGQFDQTQCKEGPKDDPQTWCPATMSQKTLSGILRKELGFKGVIISDDMTMNAIAKEYPLETALKKALNAGVDMFIVANSNSDDTTLYINTIAHLINTGEVKISRINEAYERIIALKKRLQYPSHE